GSSGSAGGYSLSDPGYGNYPSGPAQDSIPLLNMHAPAPGGTIGRQRVSQYNNSNPFLPAPDRMSTFNPPSRQFTSSPKLSSNLASSSYTPPPPPPGARLNSIDTRAPSPLLAMAAGSANVNAQSQPNVTRTGSPMPRLPSDRSNDS
ncbi:hypothetical protein BGX24_001959, partial [Mortierella sp. AD032]